MNDYRYPFITAKEPAEKLAQLESYLRQLVDKLNTESTGTVYTQSTAARQSGGMTKAESEEASFDEIKSLIIKSADIVDHLYEKFSKKLSGLYVGQSEFGQFSESTTALLEATDKRLTTTVASVESIESSNKQFQDQTRENISAIEQTANGVQISVQNIINNGVDKVVTSTGYRFDKDGLRIQSEGTAIENKLDNTGMFVTRSGETMLKADKDGVVATDVTVNNYLIVGDYSRLEDYNNGTDAQRTACFHISPT